MQEVNVEVRDYAHSPPFVFVIPPIIVLPSRPIKVIGYDLSSEWRNSTANALRIVFFILLRPTDVAADGGG